MTADRRKAASQSIHPETAAVHGPSFQDPARAHVAPLYSSTVFRFDSVAQMAAVFRGDEPGWIYGRFGGPTVDLVERHLAALEGAEAAVGTSSGMAAIACALFGTLQSGDHLIASADLYGGSRTLLDGLFGRLGIEVDYFPAENPAALESRVRPYTRAIYLETPTNPTLKIVELADVAARARRHQLRMIVDNTFASPLLQRPLEWGADLVVHSATKSLGGHDDLTAGFVAGHARQVAEIREIMKNLGCCLDPHAAWLLERGLKTLGVRVERQCTNAEALANWLAVQPAVEHVYYPGRADHPGHGVARRQMSRFGGLLAFELRGGAAAVERLFSRTRLVRLAPTLGGVETIALVPAVSSHVRMTPEARRSIGISDGLVRISCGVEQVDDLKADLEAGLSG